MRISTRTKAAITFSMESSGVGGGPVNSANAMKTYLKVKDKRWRKVEVRFTQRTILRGESTTVALWLHRVFFCLCETANGFTLSP